MSIGINFTNGLIHDVMNAVVDGMNDERNHAQADERSDPFTCCQWNLGNYLLHGPERARTCPIDGESWDDDGSEGLPH